MYIPSAFLIEDFSILRTFLEEHPFGTLVMNGVDGFPVAAHLPFLWSFGQEQVVAEGHVSKHNPLATQLSSGRTVKIIIGGEHGYVSSSVYEHPNVPTYNYQAAHIFGVAEVLSEEQLTVHLEQVVATFEKNRNEPLQLETLPPEILTQYRQEIMGFRIRAFKTELAFKLSQNRNQTDFDTILKDLQQGTPGQQRLANEMKRWVRGE